jgi:hypothetical protein
VLTEAAIMGKRDELRGLKENVIVGRLIPPVPVLPITTRARRTLLARISLAERACSTTTSRRQ